MWHRGPRGAPQPKNVIPLCSCGGSRRASPSFPPHPPFTSDMLVISEVDAGGLALGRLSPVFTTGGRWKPAGLHHRDLVPNGHHTSIFNVSLTSNFNSHPAHKNTHFTLNFNYSRAQFQCIILTLTSILILVLPLVTELLGGIILVIKGIFNFPGGTLGFIKYVF